MSIEHIVSIPDFKPKPISFNKGLQVMDSCKVRIRLSDVGPF